MLLHTRHEERGANRGTQGTMQMRIKSMHTRGMAGVGLLVASLGIGLAGSRAALAQEPGELEVDVAACVDLESDLERFACYERQVEAARGGDRAGTADDDAPAGRDPQASAPEADGSSNASRAAEASLAPEASQAARAPRTGEDFGFRDFSDEPERAPELHAVVAALREREPNQYLITLENGQMWRQMRPARYPLRAGHAVRIYPTGWGSSYRLTAEELNGYIQVERIR